LNHYVVDRYDDAVEAIKILSEAQKGRANFFVLEAFTSVQHPKVELPAGGVAALEVVEYEEKYSAVVHFLLDQVVIVPGLDQAITQVESEGVVLLSQDGRFVRRKHILGGGSVGLFEGKKLGRKKNLKKLEDSLKKLQVKVDQKDNILDDINDRLARLDEEDYSEQLDLEKNKYEELKREEVYVQSQMEHFQDTESGIQGEVSLIRERISQYEHKNQNLTLLITDAQQAIDTERLKVKQVDEKYAEIATRVTDQTERLNLKNIEYIRHQSTRLAIERELEYSRNQMEELRQQLKDDGVQMEQNIKTIATTSLELDDLESKLLKDYEMRKGREVDLSDIEQTYYQARGEISAIEDEIRRIHKKQHDQQELVNNLKDEFTNVKFKMSNVGERLNIEFGVSLEELLKEQRENEEQEVDIEAMDEKVERMRNRIANYGEINPMAVDAYDEMYVRYESITVQRDDILDARDSLLETIQEIERTATERFMEAFSAVRENFIEVFRSLFTEDDNCDLILIDPQSPLTSPIEIIAKPKGKRPKTLSQLSGGEKTLTAIALLFGLYLLKPAPFCIFDEVDAPLDDANIEKFNRIIKRFSHDSQFIIVTHNKLTMASVDVIYGVYMEEQGISSVSPVDFRGFEHASLLEVTS
ncbi:MAG: AAA family ATPase, partial [Saprospiraceae bacterium]|nr:AAA family ATPase [Saprospiraceae bacterium]